jgi:hypothetical protein
VKRVHLVEFEDYPWFPSWLRTCMTNNIVVLARWIGVTRALAHLVERVLGEHALDHVVDLGSGGGGVMPDVLSRVRGTQATSHVELTMTDLYPNLDAIETWNDPEHHIRYLETPVDATRLDAAPAGLKTMCNCFHHMRPDMARTILKSAHDNRQPLLIYEMGQNVPAIAWLLSLPIALPIIGSLVFFMTPFVRPLTFRQLFFTYVIPLIPIFYAWDGHASSPRIYAFEDLDQLLEGLDDPGYRWEKGKAKDGDGKGVGVYLLGVPAGSSSS